MDGRKRGVFGKKGLREKKKNKATLRLSANTLPMLPQHKGGPRFDIAGFIWAQRAIRLQCFQVNDDHRKFLNWRAADSNLSVDSQAHPSSGAKAALPRQVRTFEDSDDELPVTQSAGSLSAPLVEVFLNGVRNPRPVDGWPDAP